VWVASSLFHKHESLEPLAIIKPSTHGPAVLRIMTAIISGLIIAFYARQIWMAQPR
jgi:hypothetical protein